MTDNYVTIRIKYDEQYICLCLVVCLSHLYLIGHGNNTKPLYSNIDNYKYMTDNYINLSI